MITLWLIGWCFTITLCTPQEVLSSNTFWQNAKNDMNYLFTWPLQLGAFVRTIVFK